MVRVREMLALIAALGTLLALPATPHADPVVPPRLYSAIQQGENVEIKLWSHWEGSLEITRTLIRRNLETDKLEILFEDKTITENDPWDCSVDICFQPAFENCPEHPDDCYDCDGDEIEECPYYTICEPYGCLLTIVDECVPPQEMRYTYFEWEGDQCVSIGDREVLVEDVGQDCPDGDLDEHECYQPPGPDADGDSDGDVDTDTDTGTGGNDDSQLGNAPAGGDGGCSAAGVGFSGATRPTALMLLLGLASLLWSRRRS